MASLGMNDVKNGQKILVNNEPAIITETDYVKPGKGQAFTRVRYRLIKSGRVQEITMKSTDSVEAADVVDTDMQYLYSDGEYWHFMNPESFEQVQSDKAGMGGAEKWLKGEETCVVTLWNGTPIMVTPPNFVELKITETDPGVRGDTSGGGGKPATLETGAVVRVPLFVGQEEVIKVDTRSGEYVSRVKEGRGRAPSRPASSRAKGRILSSISRRRDPGAPRRQARNARVVAVAGAESPRHRLRVRCTATIDRCTAAGVRAATVRGRGRKRAHRQRAVQSDLSECGA